jgi:hypothetical protein
MSSIGAVEKLLNSIGNIIRVSRKFTLIATAVFNLAFLGRTPEIEKRRGAPVEAHARNCLLRYSGTAHHEVFGHVIVSKIERCRVS